MNPPKESWLKLFNSLCTEHTACEWNKFRSVIIIVTNPLQLEPRAINEND